MPRWAVDFEPGKRVDVAPFLGRVVEAEAGKRSVLKIPLSPAMSRRFNEINILRQIRGTTGIEGNTLDERAIERVLREPEAAPGSVEEVEVLNAQRVLEFVRQELRARPVAPVTEDLVRTLHRLDTEGCAYASNEPGHYRAHEVVAGDYLPPDHRDVPELMRRFVEFINSRLVVDGHGPLLRAVLAHFYLVSIHPFGDGNGRTSRALEAYLLYQAGYNVRGFYSLANYYYRHRADYIARLQEARFERQGDPTVFLCFALAGFVEELQTIQDEILAYVTKVVFRDLFLEAARDGRLNDRGRSLLEYLTFDNPEGIPVEAFRGRTHHIAVGLYSGVKSQKTLLRDLQTWLASGLLAERGHRLVANLDLLSQDAPAEPSLSGAGRDAARASRKVLRRPPKK